MGVSLEKYRTIRRGKKLFEQAKKNVNVCLADLSVDERVARVAYLLTGYMKQTLTEREHDELDEWVGASDKNMRIFEVLTDEKNIEAALNYLYEIEENNPKI